MVSVNASMYYSVNLLLFPSELGMMAVTPQLQAALVSVPTFAGSEMVILIFATSRNYLSGFWMLSM